MIAQGSAAEAATLRKILDAHEDCIKVLDLAGYLLSVNAGGVAALELGSADDIVGRFWPDTWTGDGQGAADEAVKAAAQGRAYRFAAAATTAKGTVKFWDVQVSPMLDDVGAPSSILVVSRDITAQQRLFEQTSNLSALHSAVLESATDYAIIALDRQGLVTLWNHGARLIMQWSEAEMLGRSAHLFFTEDEVATGVPEAEMALALETGRGEDERWHRRKDGTQFWAHGLMMPLRTDDGRHIGFVKILRDRTDARQEAEHRQLMMDELNHRVKNTLAVVQGIVSQSLRGAASPEEARRAVMERISILSRAQDTLTRTSWDGAPLREVVETATAPLVPGSGRMLLSGPHVDLGARSVLSLTMALHELGTNATKYGALSNDSGRVHIAWRILGDEFELEWREEGGPTVTPPDRRGFGSRLIESGLARGLGGRTSLDFNPTGVCWRVQAPLAIVRQA